MKLAKTLLPTLKNEMKLMQQVHHPMQPSQEPIQQRQRQYLDFLLDMSFQLYGYLL